MRVVPLACSVIAVMAVNGIPVARADFTGFTSPSGNIGCFLVEDYARCDIRERDWSPPPRPADCASFTGYGQGIGLDAGKPARFVCAGDTAMSSDRPLGYGESITKGVLTCSSAQSGITCRDTQSGHGFSIARQGYQLF